MTGLLLSIVSLIYLCVSVGYYQEENLGMAIAFMAYAVANVGLWMAGNL